MTLPTQVEADLAKGPSLAGTPLKSERILLVGSNDEFSQKVLSVLEGRECEVLGVESWNSVEEKIREHPCQLVVFDLTRLDDKGGSVTSQTMKSDNPLSVIVVTTGSPLEDQYLKQVRPYLRLTHPVSTEVLGPVLMAGLERSRLLAENASLKGKVLFDDLTSAYNRRYLRRHLEEELERSSRYRHSFSILFTDLDNLKAINDRYGHFYGSHVLRQVAESCHSHLRRSDKIFRFGGDEFVLTLPETDKRQALQVVKRISQTLPLERLGTESQETTGITMSFGIATFPGDGKTPRELIQKADQEMYKAKAAR